MKLESEIKFHVSGVPYTVKASDVSPDTSLNEYLRDKLHLTGTKKMCLEGGCGVCIVAVEEVDADGNKKVFAVNSCLVSIFSCHGWKILSNEGIGGPLTKYNEVQQLLADNNGTQCGFCSSGMVMSMYAFHQSGSKTKEQIEKAFGGNLCRCTGYRPILTAFKKLAIDADDDTKIHDLEDFKPCKGLRCQNGCPKPCKKTPLCYELGDSRWVKVYTLADLLEILSSSSGTYMLVAGNTAKGVYWQTSTQDVYIDITGVLELTSYSAQDDALTLGGNINLSDTMTIFSTTAKANTKFAYLEKLVDHLDLVAHVPVRNIGTIAGNLMIKFTHAAFPSDIFLILETVAATIVIVDTQENETRVTPENFLKVDMNKKVIKQIILPGYDATYNYMSYKIMPRAQNAHAMINAGFLLKLDTKGTVQSARIVYGGISSTFIHASTTEALLIGKVLFDNATLQAAFKSLDSELVLDWVLPDPSPTFRKQLAINLFYKYVLSIAPASVVSARNKSGGTLLTRPVSTGTQEIYSDKSLYPLTQPITKLEALAQTSGRAQYVLDIPDQPGQLHGILIPANAPAGSVITNIDVSAALASPGVVAFFSAKDIPGVNSIMVESIANIVPEELFCSGTTLDGFRPPYGLISRVVLSGATTIVKLRPRVQYYSQPVGVLVATSHSDAMTGSYAITIQTTPPASKPVLTVRDVIAQGLTDRITHQASFLPKSHGTDIQQVIKGQMYIDSQYHFHMETHTTVVIPTEDGLNVHAGTQWVNLIQGIISQVLNMPSQKINMFVRRLGGGYGAKLTRNAFVSGAAALAATKLDKPVRIWMMFRDNMDIIGKRYPLLSDYEVGVNATGVIQYLTTNLYTDFGVGSNEPIVIYMAPLFENCYVADTWTYDIYTVKTDNHPHCYTRAPGSLEGLAAIESIMDHIAFVLNLDPLEVRKANLDEKSHPIVVQFLDDLKQTDDIDARKAAVVAYNAANRWKKKGLAIVPMSWKMEIAGMYTTLVSIYHLDGGVAVCHSGVEMGQGINTKVAQVCAYKFGIPIEKISVKPNYNVIVPNSAPSGGSLTSEAVVYGLIKACDTLLERIKPVREKNPNASWEELIQLCQNARILLTANGLYSEDEPNIQTYPIYGCCALELEVDILTGKHEISRVDILEDVGQSMSPLIDIGQLEGAFVMGLGYHSSEELIYDTNGQLLTDRTWTYKIPGARDIPSDFRVRFSNNTPNPVGVLKSKAIAEPPLCLSIAFPLALRVALASARRDASSTAFNWYPINGPSTVENTLLNTLNDYTQYTL